jgi:hypothetical protein
MPRGGLFFPSWFRQTLLARGRLSAGGPGRLGSTPADENSWGSESRDWRVFSGIRSDSTQFVVLPGHEVLEIEHIVQKGDRFSVVREQEAATQVAEQHDPRS